jgi:phage terminase small subunit
MAKLTKKQELFVKEYLVDLNATQAAIRAGYSEKTAQEIGSQNLSKLIISEAIQTAMDKRAKRVDVNADYVLNTIVETIERCKQEIEPIFEGRGENRIFTGEFQFDSGAVLKGCELLGKHLKLFTEKIELTGELSLAEAIAKAKQRVQQS